MPFFKGKEDMGLEASLELLDLPSDATIEDANQAYAYLHQMIERFHKNDQADNSGDRQEDLDLLTCAYEKAVSFFSDRKAGFTGADDTEAGQSSTTGASPPTDLHFTINFPTAAEKAVSHDDGSTLPRPNSQTVETAVSITSRRLREAESDMESARQEVEAAAESVKTTSLQHQRTKQARIDALVAAKSARTRALLMEIEAKRAMEDAVAVAERARKRVNAARKSAKEAHSEAEKARQQVLHVSRSEETAAAETICAEDQLDKAKARLRGLTHTVVEARRKLQLFRGFGAGPSQVRPVAERCESEGNEAGVVPLQPVDRQAEARKQIMSDLIAIESSLNERKQRPASPPASVVTETDGDNRPGDRRRHERLIYPQDRRPVFTVGGRSIPIRDLSNSGMGLEPDDAVAGLRLVRGTIDFPGRPPVNVTGRVVRQDDRSLGLRLATRIGNHILDQERQLLSA